MFTRKQRSDSELLRNARCVFRMGKKPSPCPTCTRGRLALDLNVLHAHRSTSFFPEAAVGDRTATAIPIKSFILVPTP
jgi:hypothetical protein